MREINWKVKTIKDYLYLLRRRKWYLLLPFLMGTAIAIYIALTTTPVYRAETKLIAQAIERGDVLKGLSRLPIPEQEGFALIQQRILSRTLLMQVADSLQLRDYLERQKGIKVADTGIISALKKNWLSVLQKLNLKKPRELTDEKIVAYLRSMLSLQSRYGVITIAVTHSNPQMAKDIANQVSSTYVQLAKQERLIEVSATYRFIESRLQEAKARLDQSDLALKKAKEAGLMESLTNENVELVDNLAKTEADLIGVSMDIEQKQGEINQLEAQLRTSTDNGSPEVLRWKAEIARLQAQLGQLKKTFSDEWPEVKRVQTELNKAQNQLALAQEQAEKNLQQQILPRLELLRKELSQLHLSQNELTRKRNQYELVLKQAPPEQSSISHLLRDKQQNEAIYTLLLNRLHEAELLTDTETEGMGNVAKILDPAFLPEHPIKPDKPMIITMGVVAGMGIGLALLLLLEYFDHSIHSIEEAEQCFQGVPVLGVIPKLKFRHMKPVN